MKEFVVYAERIAASLKAQNQTVAVAESSAGGLITAALLAVPGASAYCLGGIVIYTRRACEAMSNFDKGLLGGSPAGNRYGDPAGHAWVAVSGPREHAVRVETGSTGRLANMRAFPAKALQLFEGALGVRRARSGVRSDRAGNKLRHERA